MFTSRLSIALALLVTAPAVASAQLRFTPANANLGELRGGPVYQQRFEFVNDAAQTIEITDIRLGCGCLQPALDKRVFQAGEKGVLVMNLRTLGQPNGPRTWQAHVQYRQDGKLQETAVVLAATIRNEITIEPSIIAMSVETTLRQEVTITDHRKTPMKVAAILGSSPAIRIVQQAQDGGVTKVTLEVSRAALTANRQEESLNIYADDPAYRQLQVPITLIRANRAEVTATPARVELTGSGSQLIRLRAVGDKAVRVEKADADHPAIKCTWAAGPGDDATLKISVDAGQLTAPSVLASVRVRLSEPAGQTVAISVALRKE
jgi:hypothetical protein